MAFESLWRKELALGCRFVGYYFECEFGGVMGGDALVELVQRECELVLVAVFGVLRVVLLEVVVV